MTQPYNTLLELLQTRRSVRRFLNQPVAPEQVQRLIEAARWAPSAGNRQAWRLLILDAPDRIHQAACAVQAQADHLVALARPDTAAQLSSYLANFHHFDTAPLLIVPIYRPGIDLLPPVESRATVPRHIVDALSSVAAAIQNLLLAAHSMGLGACWMTGPLIASEALAALIDVPEGWEIAAVVPVGRPAEVPSAPTRRPAERLCKRT